MLAAYSREDSNGMGYADCRNCCDPSLVGSWCATNASGRSTEGREFSPIDDARISAFTLTCFPQEERDT
jgi:hypothetical protein